MIDSTNDLDLDYSFKNSLLFYTILKMLIQTKLSDAKLILLQSKITSNLLENYTNSNEFKKFLLYSEDIIKYSNAKRNEYETLINSITDENINNWKIFCDFAIDLLLIKDLIISVSKAYLNDKIIENNKKTKDKLSIEFDLANLNMPYGLRVIASIIVSNILDENRENLFLLARTNKKIENLNFKIMNLKKEYKISANNIYSLIISESINQSIKSDAGCSYESRFYETILPLVDSIQGHSHDKYIP